MRYREAFTIWFRRKDWFTQMLQLALAHLIPYVGIMVLIGYEGDVFLAHQEAPAEVEPPKFEFARFGEYLSHGLWPTLVFWVGLLPVIFVVGVIYFVLFVGFAVAGAHGGWFITILFIMIPVSVLCNLLLTVAVMPLMLRSLLTQGFASGFDWAFYRTFLRMEGVPFFVGMLLVIAANVVLSIAGVLMCYVGVFLTTTLGALAMWRMLLMAYEEYLARGGTPVPLGLSPARVPPGFPVTVATPPAAPLATAPAPSDVPPFPPTS